MEAQPLLLLNRLTIVLRSDQRWLLSRQHLDLRQSALCSKTYFAIDRIGELRPITVKAYIVPGLRYDLLSVKGLNRAGYRVIHDEDGHESGIYAVINKKIDHSKSFAFMSEHSNLFYLKIEQTNAQQFEKQTGYNLWHRRMGHSTNHAIRASIKCTTGMESLIGVNYESHVQCPSCMLGKATLEDYPGARARKVPPLYQNLYGLFLIFDQIH